MGAWLPSWDPRVAADIRFHRALTRWGPWPFLFLLAVLDLKRSLVFSE